ncbi:MAG TPA: hypothetical protein VGG61_14330 [Gemmataceae bacterium]
MTLLMSFPWRPRTRLMRLCICLGLVACVVAGLTANHQRSFALAPAAPPDPEKCWKKAQCDGKYAMLLHQFKVEKDADEIGEFKDLGHRSRSKYAGQTDLSPGWWVYVQPYWFIWGERTDRPKRAKRDFGPEQLVGEPDVPGGGNSPKAWCSKTDDQDEWLLLEYDEPMKATAVIVHENYFPGAVHKVSIFKFDGTEVEAWKGKDPTAAGNASGVSEIEFEAEFKITRVKIYLDRKNVAGWNEVDAVGLRDENKKTQWAAHAVASSTYAPDNAAEDKTAELEEQISNLEEDVKALRKAVEELRRQINKKDK